MKNCPITSIKDIASLAAFIPQQKYTNTTPSRALMHEDKDVKNHGKKFIGTTAHVEVNGTRENLE